MRKISDSTYFDSTPSEQTTPEERAGLNPPTEEQLRRTNPKREDPRENLLTDNNEHGHDSPIGNRYDNNIPLESSLKLTWQAAKILYQKDIRQEDYFNMACCWIRKLRGYWFVIQKKTGETKGDLVNTTDEFTTMQQARDAAIEFAAKNRIPYIITKDEENYTKDTESSLKLSWLTFQLGDIVKLNNKNKYKDIQYAEQILDSDLRIDYINDVAATCTVYTAKPDVYGKYAVLYGVSFSDLVLIKRHAKIAPESSMVKESWVNVREFKYQDIDMSQPDFKGKYNYYILGNKNKWHVAESEPGRLVDKSISQNMSYSKATALAHQLAAEKQGNYIISAQEQIYLENLQKKAESSLKLSWMAAPTAPWVVGEVEKDVYSAWTFPSDYDKGWEYDKGWKPTEEKKNRAYWKVYSSPVGSKYANKIIEGLTYEEAVAECNRIAMAHNGVYYITEPDKLMQEYMRNVITSLKISWEKSAPETDMFNTKGKVGVRHMSSPMQDADARKKCQYLAHKNSGMYYIGKEEKAYRDSMQKQTEASLEEIDWEIDRTIEAYNSMRVVASEQEPFTEKLKKRYEIAAVPRATIAVNSGKGTLHPFEQRAVDEYGTTEVPISAAFIMSNGQLIDSSGQRQGAWGEGRSVDHREIASAGIGDEALPDEYENRDVGSSSNGLVYYMTMTGNIRISIDSRDSGITVDMQNPMNKAQWDTFVALAYNKEIYADFCDKMGNRIDSGDYTNLRDFKKAYNKVYGKQATASETYPEILSNSAMRGFMMQRGPWLFDAFGKMDYNTIKEIAGAADVWRLKEIPLDQFDWVATPAARKKIFPVIVFEEDGRYEVLAGKHRIGEAKARGEKTILAYVGNQDESAKESSLKLTYAASNEEINAQVYEDRDRQQKDGPEMFWGSEDGQRTRFEFILSDGNKEKDLKEKFTGKSILDVGCGYADLFKYFLHHDIELKSYTGIDIVKKAINMCKRKYEATFEVRDLSKDSYPDNSFDYVYGIGIFALNADNFEQYVEAMLKNMYKVCRIEAAANFALGKQKTGQFRSITPEELKNIVDFTQNYKIEIDKNNQEFTVFIRK